MNITLIDGRSVPRDQIRFEAGNMRFYLGSEDITNNVHRADKLTFSGFDVNADNRRLSYERQNGVTITEIPGPLEESTAAILKEQLINDPLGAPLDTLDKTTKKILGSFGIQTVIFAALVALFFWAGGLVWLKGILAKGK